MTNNSERYFYGKADKLKSRKTLEHLFRRGNSFSVHPLKIFWLRNEDRGIQAGVGASSGIFKKATDRNRIKRLLREGYRLQKNQLQAEINEQNGLSIFILYNGRELPQYEIIYRQVGVALKKMIKIINEKDS